MRLVIKFVTLGLLVSVPIRAWMICSSLGWGSAWTWGSGWEVPV